MLTLACLYSYIAMSSSSSSSVELDAHKCIFCSTVKKCKVNQCECFLFANLLFCNRSCKDDYILEVKLIEMRYNNVIPCDLHVFFDFETTGLDFIHDQVTEFGAVVDMVWARRSNIKHIQEKLKEDSSEKSFQFQTLIKTSVPIDPRVVELNGITQDKLNKEGVTKEVAMAKFFSWIKSFINRRPAVVYLTAYNAHRFDMKFLLKLMKVSKQDPPDYIHFCVSDSFKACKRTFGPNEGSMKLESVYNRVVKPEHIEQQKHRAIEDNFMQMDIVKAMTKEQQTTFYRDLIENSKPISVVYVTNKKQ